MKYLLKSMLFVFIAFSVIQSQVKAPKLEIAEMEHNFGKITEGVLVSHSFILKNAGSDNLIIERVKASCGCTAVQPDKNVLKPGESTPVKVTFNTSNRKGLQKKYVYVFTNDPELKDVRLTFTAEVIPKEEVSQSDNAQIKLEKVYHNFGDAKEGTILSLNLEIGNTGAADLHIKEVKASCGCTSTMLSSKTLKPGENGELRIDFDTSQRFGKITRTVSVFSDDPANPEKTITLFVNILKQDS